AGIHLALGERELVSLEGGVKEKVDGRGEDRVEVALEGRPAQRGVGGASGGFDARGLELELIVELVAVDGVGAAGAPGLAVHGDEADLVSRLFATASTDKDGAVDEGKFVVLLEEDHEAVRELDALGLLRLEGVKRWDRNLFPRLGGSNGSCGFRWR